MKRLILAIQFLTIVPIKKGLAPDKGDLARSMAFFPVVGAMQGGILAAIDYGLSGILPQTVVSAILLAALALINNGLHLDGFADTVDGLAGGNTPDERLRIMRDSSVGALAVVALILLILIKFLSINEMNGSSRTAVIFIFPVIGKWCMVLLSCLAPPAREDGLGASFTANSYSTFVVATGLTVAASWLLLGLGSLAVIGVMAVWTYLIAIFFKRKLGGITGDVFGFHSELSEGLTLIFFLTALRVV
ncbi:MAG: adenosylcobinamide-GDP ribazoletransferase [Deltaproteobacteria bacterium]|nr:adenosylcobinamide-GDP ribazoletransferase [Deltaproteobacteria bacterium]